MSDLTDRPTGWQADCSYVPCPNCGCPAPPEADDPPFALSVPVLPRTKGTAYHHRTCPLVALPADVQAKLDADLREMARLRARAEAESRFYVIG